MIESVNQRCCGRNINNKTRPDNTNPAIRYKRLARLTLCRSPGTWPKVAGSCFAQNSTILSSFFSYCYISRLPLMAFMCLLRDTTQHIWTRNPKKYNNPDNYIIIRSSCLTYPLFLFLRRIGERCESVSFKNWQSVQWRVRLPLWG